MKKICVLTVIGVLLAVTLLANIPATSAMESSATPAANHLQSTMLTDLDMKQIQGNGLIACLVGIGVAVKGIIELASGDWLGGALSYAAGLQAIYKECRLKF